MHVKNTTVFDKKTMKAFASFWLRPVKKNGWIGYALFAFLILGILGIAILEIVTGKIIAEFLILLVIALLYVVLMIFLRQKLVKSYQKRKIEKMEYTFEESSFQIKASSEIVSADDTLSYRGIKKVYETKTALYFVTDSGVYLVAYAGFESFEERMLVKEKLKSVLGKNYICCR